jgi:hypothetical protein
MAIWSIDSHFLCGSLLHAGVPKMKSLLLIALQLITSGGDAYQTYHYSHRPEFYEVNPLARPFIRSPYGTAAYFSFDAAAHIGGAWLLRRKGHGRLGTMLAIEGIADNSAFAGYTAWEWSQPTPKPQVIVVTSASGPVLPQPIEVNEEVRKFSAVPSQPSQAH